MRVLILHNEVGQLASPDDADVLEQVAAVEVSLAGLGHQSSTFACTLDLAALRREIEQRQPHLVFNLVESLAGEDRLIALVPTLLEVLQIPFTGSSSRAIQRSTDKVGIKDRLRTAGIPSPAVVAMWPPRRSAIEGGIESLPSVLHPVIVKSRWRHGSHGLLDDVVLAPGADLVAEMRRIGPRLGMPCLAETYLEGREINVSLISGPNGVRALPPAEIRFQDYPAGKPRIVGYRAKWQADSFEYQNTPRSFDFAESDSQILALAVDLALRSWQIVGLSGYGRVDLRVDREGKPWVLEINANPCLSPDAGFAAALERAGISFSQAVGWILDARLGEDVRFEPVLAAV